MTRTRQYQLLLCLCAIVLLGLTAWILNQTYGVEALHKKAAIIRAGDDYGRVRSILGSPRDSMKMRDTNGLGALLTGGETEWWAYGSRLHDLDWRHPFTRDFPWIVPIKWHFFSPDTNDVAIYFNTGGKVTHVFIPGK